MIQHIATPELESIADVDIDKDGNTVILHIVELISVNAINTIIIP
jgi:hypothetical protein